MTYLPPENNPLLNTRNPQPGGYLTPSRPTPPPPSPGTPGPTPSASGPTPAPMDPAAPPPPLPSAPLPSATPPAKVAKKPERPNTTESVIDTIESIIIALILALTFRAFVVEAFVIPTGSMAPTLLGAHFNVICPACGWKFTESVNTAYQLNPAGTSIMQADPRSEPRTSSSLPAEQIRRCPNCNYPVPASALPGNPIASRWTYENGDNIQFPWTNNGDRILVLKYLYNIIEPQRWDVIVFKEPSALPGRDQPLAPKDNYIKRLVGLPGEKLEVIEGDVFVTPPDAPAGTDGVIARKPDHVQDALWQIIYDNDHFPLDAGRQRPDNSVFTSPWQGRGPTAANWKTDAPVVAYSGAGTGHLEFTPRDSYFLNVRGYNNDLFANMVQDHHIVNDLHLEMVWQPQTTDAAGLSLVLGPASNRFQITWSQDLQLARFNPATGQYEKITEPLLATLAPPAAGQWRRVVMNNIDHRVQLFIDGRLVLQHDTPWTAEMARAWSAELENNRQYPQVSVAVAGPAQFGHLKLMRDGYYTQELLGRESPFRSFSAREGSLTSAGAVVRQQSMRQGIKGRPIQLHSDEFFVMGDNSTMSFDSRGWDSVHPSLLDQDTRPSPDHPVEPGVVPRRFLLGRAFFVYWPAGYRPMNGASESLRRVDVPLVPNVGEMRFIR